MDKPVNERPPSAARTPSKPQRAIVPAPRRGRLGTRILRSAAVQQTAATLIASYLRLVNRTSRLTFVPEAPYATYYYLAPFIFTMWHGQHFMLPFARTFPFDVRVLISRHHDGELNALVAEKLGIGTIRGSGGRDPSRVLAKGGIAGFMEMKAALEEGACVTMTADISNLAARRAGLGVVALAKASGRPILPIAYASSRRLDIKNSWDRSTINLPFSRAVFVVEEPVFVPADADDALLEQRRQAVQDGLNRATEQAYAIADRRPA